MYQLLKIQAMCQSWFAGNYVCLVSILHSMMSYQELKIGSEIRVIFVCLVAFYCCCCFFPQKQSYNIQLIRGHCPHQACGLEMHSECNRGENKFLIGHIGKTTYYTILKVQEGK